MILLLNFYLSYVNQNPRKLLYKLAYTYKIEELKVTEHQKFSIF